MNRDLARDNHRLVGTGQPLHANVRTLHEFDAKFATENSSGRIADCDSFALWRGWDGSATWSSPRAIP
jgi:hypothetical protein